MRRCKLLYGSTARVFSVWVPTVGSSIQMMTTTRCALFPFVLLCALLAHAGARPVQDAATSAAGTGQGAILDAKVLIFGQAWHVCVCERESVCPGIGRQREESDISDVARLCCFRFLNPVGVVQGKLRAKHEYIEQSQGIPDRLQMFRFSWLTILPPTITRRDRRQTASQ